MWTVCSRIAVITTILGGLASVLLYFTHSPQAPAGGTLLSSVISSDLLRLLVDLSLFLALALVVLRQHALERRLPTYETLTDVQEARLRARDEEIARLKEHLVAKEEERKRTGAMLMAFLKSTGEGGQKEEQ